MTRSNRLDGEDLRGEPLIERKRRLDGLIPPEKRIIKVAWFPERGRELFAATNDLDLDRIVAKKRTDPYTAATKWYKIKNPRYSLRPVGSENGVIRRFNGLRVAAAEDRFCVTECYNG